MAQHKFQTEYPIRQSVIQHKSWNVCNLASFEKASGEGTAQQTISFRDETTNMELSLNSFYRT